MTEVRLTAYSRGAGCACKLGPDELAAVMGGVWGHPAASHPDLLVGVDTSDDAGVYRLGDGRALVQTVDIFTPVVDAPRDWGRIAAANALSDIYAKGAQPLTALQFLAWPRGKLDFSVAGEVIEGGLSVMEAAACTVVGGHSIDAPEPTYGFAVTGVVADDGFLPNSGAVPGDDIVLTKPLGIGIATTAIKRGACPPQLARLVVETMASLNDAAGAALATHRATAATDVTGFGLLGHLRQLCRASGVGAEVEMGEVPVLPGVRELLARGMWAGGSQRNLEAVEDDVELKVAPDEGRLLADAQTSGGLLVTLPPAETDGYLAEVPGAARIGRVTSAGRILVTR